MELIKELTLLNISKSVIFARLQDGLKDISKVFTSKNKEKSFIQPWPNWRVIVYFISLCMRHDKSISSTSTPVQIIQAKGCVIWI